MAGGGDRLDGVRVEVVLFGPVGSTGSLVLRRIVSIELADGDEERVEELWSSVIRHESLRAAVRGVRELGAVGARLLLGEPLDDVPGMAAPTADRLAGLTARTRQAGHTDVLVEVRGRVDDLTGDRILTDIDIDSAPTFLGWAARQVVLESIEALRMVPADTSTAAGDAEIESPAGWGAVTGAALHQDLDRARARLEQQTRWQHIADARLHRSELPSRPTEVGDQATSAEPRWSWWQRDDLPLDPASASFEPVEGSLVTVFIGVEGGQFGEHNQQVNLYRYRLRPTIDLRSVLSDRSVRDALTAFAVSGTAEAREAAVDAVRGLRATGPTDWTRGERRTDQVQPEVSETIRGIAGTVVICDCRGMQVGNRLRQYNTFSAVVTPTVAAHDLFLASPDLVETIVDYACGGDGVSRGTVRDRLAEAVCGSADRALAPPGPRTGRAGDVLRAVRGVTVGADIRQTDVRELAARIPTAAQRAVEQARKRAAAEVERARREREREEREARLERARAERERQAQLEREEEERARAALELVQWMQQEDRDESYERERMQPRGRQMEL